MIGNGVAIIIQARMGSTRLPGKSLMPVFGDISLAEMVFARAQSAGLSERVILATSEEPDCDPLAALAESIGIGVIRGDEQNVLSRFVCAVSTFSLEHVVRICADNPLASGQEIDRLISFYFEQDVDYARSNTATSGLPDGLGCEMIRADILVREASGASKASREHVTEFIEERPGDFRTAELIVPEELHCPMAKLDIDTPEDMVRMRRFLAGLPTEGAPLWSSETIVAHCRTEGLCGGRP